MHLVEIGGETGGVKGAAPDERGERQEKTGNGAAHACFSHLPVSFWRQ